MKSIMTHFYNICNGKDDYSDDYSPYVIDNLFSSYHDTVHLASYMDMLDVPPEVHYMMYQLYTPKGMRQKPKFMKQNKQ